MSTHPLLPALLLALLWLAPFAASAPPATPPARPAAELPWEVERFADVRILRYRVHGWEELTTQQRQLVYYLTQAGLAGRDIIWDQNYRYNLALRELLEQVYSGYRGDGEDAEFQALATYLKRAWHANGIHHPSSGEKFTPGFSRPWFEGLLRQLEIAADPVLLAAIFDPEMDATHVQSNPARGLVETSAVNYFAPGIRTAEVRAFYASRVDSKAANPISHGLNSRLARAADGTLYEQVYKVGGHYGPALAQVVRWLELAAGVAESPQQAAGLRLLADYYRSGDLKLWDEYNIQWLQDTDGDIDYIQGFVETYDDPLAQRGAFESVVQIKDRAATARLDTLRRNAAWFETNSPTLPAHKREDVTGVAFHVVNVASLGGDASVGDTVGVNLPNAEWIRSRYGSKSVSLANLEEAYEASTGARYVEAFGHDAEELARYREHGAQAASLLTALHEVIGHASGQLEPGAAPPGETLASYAATIEEGRADLMALYFLLDPKLVELGVMPSLETGRAAYDDYIRNAMLVQLRKLEPGAQLEGAHMRNRAWISRWVMARGAADDVILTVKRDGKTYYDIRDYDRLRALFGDLLREVQRIKSQGDYAAARDLVEGYGVNVDAALVREVRARAAALGIPPNTGFIQPEFAPRYGDGGRLVDVELAYPQDYAEQMLRYSREFGLLQPGPAGEL